MLKIGVMVSGGGTNLQAIIDSIKGGKINNASIEVVVSNNENAFALKRANANNIDAVCVSPRDFSSREEFDKHLLMTLDKYKLDLIVLAGYLLVIPELLISKYKNKIINIHPSLIPAFCGDGYYGLNVHKEALDRGVKITGATVHFVDEGTDTGPIILQKAVEVLEGDTAEELQKRVMEEAEWDILPEAIRLISEDKIKVKDNKVIIGE